MFTVDTLLPTRASGDQREWTGWGYGYPMICFNGPRPQKDGTHSDRTKYGLISDYS